MKIKDFLSATALALTDFMPLGQDVNSRKTTIQDFKNFILTDVNTSLSEKANYNYCINGNFDIWQRGTSVVNPYNASYLTDRFEIGYTLTGTPPTTVTHSRQNAISSELLGSQYFYRINSDSLGVLNSSDISQLICNIENGVKKLCGTGRKITISFMARSSITNKKIGIYLSKVFGTGGSPSSSVIINGSYFTLTSQWTKYHLTVDSGDISSSTFGTNNDDILKIRFINAYGSAQALNVGDTVGELFGIGNVDITQVKIESGDKATPFVPRPIGEEEMLCKRYYNSVDFGFMYTYNTGSTNINRNFIAFPIPMRIAPTVATTPYSGSTITTVESITKYGFSFGGAASNSIIKSYTADSEIY